MGKTGKDAHPTRIIIVGCVTLRLIWKENCNFNRVTHQFRDCDNDVIVKQRYKKVIFFLYIEMLLSLIKKTSLNREIHL